MTEEIAVQPIGTALTEQGFIHLPASGWQGSFPWSAEDWAVFAESWERLGPDLYMADGGRYRRRRHAAFDLRGRTIVRKPHQPHYQSRDYNPLNGGVQRWFEPIEAEVADSPVIREIFQMFTPLFSALDGRGDDARWHSEVHQFRIESSSAMPGLPTPEGLHRDGVDWVVVMLVARRNVGEGVTMIGELTGEPLGHFTLRNAADMVVLDDRRIKHGVTPVRVSAPALPAYRDALVMTWQADHGGAR